MSDYYAAPNYFAPFAGLLQGVREGTEDRRRREKEDEEHQQEQAVREAQLRQSEAQLNQYNREEEHWAKNFAEQEEQRKIEAQRRGMTDARDRLAFFKVNRQWDRITPELVQEAYGTPVEDATSLITTMKEDDARQRIQSRSEEIKAFRDSLKGLKPEIALARAKQMYPTYGWVLQEFQDKPKTPAELQKEKDELLVRQQAHVTALITGDQYEAAQLAAKQYGFPWWQKIKRPPEPWHAPAPPPVRYPAIDPFGVETYVTGEKFDVIDPKTKRRVYRRADSLAQKAAAKASQIFTKTEMSQTINPLRKAYEDNPVQANLDALNAVAKSRGVVYVDVDGKTVMYNNSTGGVIEDDLTTGASSSSRIPAADSGKEKGKLWVE